MNSNNKTAKKMIASIAAIIILLFCLSITTYALMREMVSVENNIFYTGRVQINLNDGKPIIEEDEFLFEPGMTVKKDFFLKNQSTWDVYYKIYFDNVQGGLATVIEITILDGDKVLLSGTAAELSRTNVGVANDVLGVNEKRELTVYFHYPEKAENGTQNLTLSFDMCADAVQTKNNPNKNFD